MDRFSLLLRQHMSLHPTDSHWHDTIAVFLNDHSVRLPHMYIHPRDHHFLVPIVALVSDQFLPRTRRSIYPTDNHSHGTISVTASVRGEQQWHRYVLPKVHHFLVPIAAPVRDHS